MIPMMLQINASWTDSDCPPPFLTSPVLAGGQRDPPPPASLCRLEQNILGKCLHHELETI